MAGPPGYIGDTGSTGVQGVPGFIRTGLFPRNTKLKEYIVLSTV